MKEVLLRIGKVLLQLIAVLALTLFPFYVLATHFRLSSKLNQRMPALEYHNTTLRTILQDLADKSRKPLKLGVCRSIAEKSVTVSFEKGTKLRDILQNLCVEPECNFQLSTHVDVQLQYPKLYCKSDQAGELLEIKSID
jgi:hypothetical protein